MATLGVAVAIVMLLQVVVVACSRNQQQHHRKLRRASKDNVIRSSYLVSLDPTRVVSAREAAAAKLQDHDDATIDYIFDGYAALGFEVANVNDALLQLLLDDDDVLAVEENQATLLQDEPPQQYTRTMEQTITDDGTWGLDYMSWPLDNLYSWNRNGTGVTAYILDTGIHLQHDEFAPNRADCAYEVVEQGTNCQDFHGHGTHVASVVGGNEFGMAKNVMLQAVKVVDASGKGSMATVVAGIDWVIAHRQASIMSQNDSTTTTAYPAIINLSIGGGVSAMLNEAITRASDSGILVVAAAGNQNGQDACDMSPPSSAACFSVAALNQESEPAYFSNVGSCVDLWAPGVGIRGAGIESVDASSIRTGTSQASPHVTGLASLYMQSGLSAAETKLAMIRDARYVELLGQGSSPPLAAYSGFVSTQSIHNDTADDTTLSTDEPSLLLTSMPSYPPSLRPTNVPSLHPTTAEPSLQSTLAPSNQPAPTLAPTVKETSTSTNKPTPITMMPTIILPSSSPLLRPARDDFVQIWRTQGPTESRTVDPQLESDFPSTALELILTETPSSSGPLPSILSVETSSAFSGNNLFMWTTSGTVMARVTQISTLLLYAAYII